MAPVSSIPPRNSRLTAAVALCGAIAACAPHGARARWVLGPDNVVSCWKNSVLQDVEDGWRDRCLGLVERPEFLTMDDCGLECRRDASCPLWQFNNGSGYYARCWWGQGSGCRADNGLTRSPFYGSDPKGRPIEITGGQRIQHGDVRTLKTLIDVEVVGLFVHGFFEEGDAAEGQRRCKTLCYSDTNCTFWQYGEDGCRVERSPLNVYSGLERSHTSFAMTSLGGQEIEHSCPHEEKGSEMTTPVLWIALGAAGIAACVVLAFLVKIQKARTRRGKRKDRNKEAQERELISGDGESGE